MSHRAIAPPNAPAALGPYSPGIVFDGGKLIFTSGQGPLDPQTGKIVSGSIADQTARVLENIRAILEAAGSSMDRVLKTTVFLTNMDDFPAMNEVYARYFPGTKPARSTVQAVRLPLNIDVEIDAIATL